MILTIRVFTHTWLLFTHVNPVCIFGGGDSSLTSRKIFVLVWYLIPFFVFFCHLLFASVSGISSLCRCSGSGPEPAGSCSVPSLPVLLLQRHRWGHQKTRGLLCNLGWHHHRSHHVVSLKGSCFPTEAQIHLFIHSINWCNNTMYFNLIGAPLRKSTGLPNWINLKFKCESTDFAPCSVYALDTKFIRLVQLVGTRRCRSSLCPSPIHSIHPAII